MTTEKAPRWFIATVKAEKRTEFSQKFRGVAYLFNVKKSWNEGKVIIWNGRFFIEHVAQEWAKEFLTLESVDPNQTKAEDQFQWYLNY